MRVSLDLPKTKRDPLLSSLNRSFESQQKTIMGLAKSLDALEELGKRHDKLLSVLDDLMENVRKKKKASGERSALSESMVSRLEDAILKASSRSKNRTFGSNY